MHDGTEYRELTQGQISIKGVRTLILEHTSRNPAHREVNRIMCILEQSLETLSGALKRPRAAHINSAAHSREFSISKAEQQHLHDGPDPGDLIQGHCSVTGHRRLFLGHPQTNQAHQRLIRKNRVQKRSLEIFSRGTERQMVVHIIFAAHSKKFSISIAEHEPLT